MSLKFLELGDLLERGYFPNELPPPFTTAIFADSVGNSWARYCDKFKKRCVTKPVNHSIPRVGSLRRKLSIPNPIAFFQLSKEIAESKDEIDSLLYPDSYSVTTPHVNDGEGRAVVPSKWFNDLPRMRAKQRSNARFLVKADVSKFYHSIYTHSIPWAIHGKAFAKTHRGCDYLGNRLDTYLRNGQDAQTVGIPIGPDTSLIIAEIILSQVDKEVVSANNLSGFRFVDDYEISCKSMAEVETVISVLETALSRYELQLNPAKLKIIELPDDLDSQWAT
ncbi:MAG: RNA-directed DNA polymerase [Pseudodesulfovibrio sp.]|uniref:RNA-directed DNA polymerase n=1 Tax=Pseudodesulfovibrio sp. TaxID=2035812 RepID=UPI003D0CE24B